MTPQTEAPFLRVTAIEVKDLFGIYHHKVVLNAEDRITIIHGPNGVGKTVLLGLTTAVLTNRMTRFLEVPFSTFIVSFDDGSVLTLKKTRQTSSEKNAEVEQSAVMELVHLKKDGTADEWTHVITGDIPDTGETAARYVTSFRPQPKKNTKQTPDWLTDLRRLMNLHFIDTQRLFQVPQNFNTFRNTKARTVETVCQYAEDLKNRISETLTDYGRHSEKLDQTFPQRLLGTATANLDIAQLKQKMTEIRNRRSKLRDIGLLSEFSDNPAAEPNDSIDETQRRVMTLYVQDTLNKLSVFDELAQRIEVLCDIVNQKFKNKKIVIQRDVGLQAVGPNNQPLPLEALSSGEQHEIVLLYNLLFKVKRNTLVLLDEPELSLHVTWQKNFLEDLSKIVALSEFDVVLATHSPYIVGDRSDLMIPLSTEVSQ